MISGMNDLNHTIKRIIVNVDVGGFSLSAMESAVILASRLRADLCGLFIEDAELLELANLPFTREITLHTTQSRALSGSSIERNFIAMASQMRHTLENLAKLSDVVCSFRTIRGTRLESVIRESEDFQLILIFPKKRLTAPAYQDVTTSNSRPIVLFYDGSTQASSAVKVIKSLNDHKTIKQLLVLATSQTAEAEILDQLSSTDYRIKFEQVQDYHIADIINRVKKQPAGLVILPLEDILQKQLGGLKTLLDTLSCPLILVS